MQQVQQELTHTQQLVQQQLQSVTQQIQNSLLHVQQETTTLSRALRSTNQQGYWGELQLLQALKLAGMQEHCDFEAQKTFPTLKGSDRPDVVIQLHGERLVVVDAKAPLGSYLDAVAATTDPEVKNHMSKYTQTVRGHIRDLAKKEYWRHASFSPEFVILYLPTEAMYRAALEHDAKLFDYGMDYKVLIASPMSLLALLKVIAFGWNQQARTQNVQQILEHGQRVRRSLVQFCDQWQLLRKHLDETIKAFNQVATSYSQTVLPDLEELRRLDEMYKNTKPVEQMETDP
jgi:DNA recombination protein RmuC